MEELEQNRRNLRHHAQALALYRSIEQQSLALKPKLSPDQWARLVALLATVAQALIDIFGGGPRATGGSEPAAESSAAGNGDENGKPRP